VDIAKSSKEDHFHIGGTGKDAKITSYQDEYRRLNAGSLSKIEGGPKKTLGISLGDGSYPM